MPQIPHSVSCGAGRWGALSVIPHLQPVSFLKMLMLAQHSSTSGTLLFFGFSSLFTYSATTLEGLCWAPVLQC